MLGSTAAYVVIIGLSVTSLSLLLRTPIEVARPGLLVVALLGTLASMVALGGLLSCLFVATRAALRIAEALMYPVFVVGGMLIPVNLLPAWLRPAAWVMGPYWGSQILDAAVDGTATRPLNWILLGVTTLGYTLLTVVLFRVMLDRSRRAGTLGRL